MSTDLSVLCTRKRDSAEACTSVSTYKQGEREKKSLQPVSTRSEIHAKCFDRIIHGSALTTEPHLTSKCGQWCTCTDRAYRRNNFKPKYAYHRPRRLVIPCKLWLVHFVCCLPGVTREMYSHPNLLRSKTGLRGFYPGVHLAYAIFTPQAKPSQARTLTTMLPSRKILRWFV